MPWARVRVQERTWEILQKEDVVHGGGHQVGAGMDACRAGSVRAGSGSSTEADDLLERFLHGSRVAIEQAGDGRVGRGGGGNAP